jgi:hypothetical protein
VAAVVTTRTDHSEALIVSGAGYDIVGVAAGGAAERAAGAGRLRAGLV